MLLLAATAAWTLIINAPGGIETVKFQDQSSCYTAARKFNNNYRTPSEKRLNHAECVKDIVSSGESEVQG